MKPDYTNYWIRVTTELVSLLKNDGEPVEGSEFTVVDADDKHVWLEQLLNIPYDESSINAYIFENSPVTLCFRHKGFSTQEVLASATLLLKTFAEIDTKIRGGDDLEWISKTLDPATREGIAIRIERVWARRFWKEVEVYLYKEACEALQDLGDCQQLAELSAFDHAVMRKFRERGCVSVTHRGITRVMTDD